MSDPTPDPVHTFLRNLVLDAPPAALPLERYPEQRATAIPINNDDPIAAVMDAAAREALNEQGEQS